jgi:sulfur-carrier protein
LPRVVISGQAARRFNGGQTEFEVEANPFRRMVLELDRRFPGLGRQIEESMAVATTARSSGTPIWLSSSPRGRST